MRTFRHEQLDVRHRGRIFHFVSYEATAANPVRQIEARPDTWFLIASGHRWPAIPHQATQPSAEVKASLVSWLEEAVFGAAGAMPIEARDGAPAARRQ